MLPHVLDFYRPVIDRQPVALAVRSHMGQAAEVPDVLAQKFLDSIRTLNRELGIPRHLQALRKADIPALAKAACQEADTHYPVPRYMPLASL